MIKFAPSIEFLFTEHGDYPERVHAAAACGAAAIEMWGWQNKDLPALRSALRDSGVVAAAMVIDPLVGALAARDEFLDAVRHTAHAANEIACPTIIVISGARDGQTPPSAQQQRLIDVLGDAAQIADRLGVRLALEALNTTDHPLTFLSFIRNAIDIVEAVDSAALGLVVDLYHTTVMGDRVRGALVGREHLVRHIQLARAPGRDEPCGEVPNGDAADHLIRSGYGGFVGLEYRPSFPSKESYSMTANHWIERTR